MIRPRFALLVAVLCSPPGLVAAADEVHHLSLRGPRLGCEAPVVMSLGENVPPGNYMVQAEGSAVLGTAQVFDDDGRKWLAMVMDPGEVPTSIHIGAFPQDLKAGSPHISIEPRGRDLVVKVENDLLAEYHSDGGAKPYLFPVMGPRGVRYTRAYPMEDVPGEDRDHPHQRSFWFTHGKVNGIDFWSEAKGHGTIRETARKTVVSGHVLGRLRTTNEWLGPDGAKVLEDERVLTFYATRGLDAPRIIDFDITLRATAGPVTFGDTKEGSFGLRVASTMDVNKKLGGKIVNAEGLEDDAAWGKPSPWVDYTGPVDHRGLIATGVMSRQDVGIAILNHPDSFRFPTTWHVRTYGLFAANPFGWHDFGVGKSGDHTLPAGQEIRLRYRVILHRGDASKVRLREAFEAYSKPPEIVRTSR
ncbi:hypothetical protein OJF2_26190 [Aquisphaera giovannonii]|uniref:Methane oxygenase PmoA n=1 Tax=Aquisphaera giovannonii TaxID=406548 RepID=A0A5B9W253_9BACT|nr:PmoA family protein [Aquisphaera giovannonii]QEH34085.1 hypothetical protein OJF2_26190 [Aquisphaera giovannonii]